MDRRLSAAARVFEDFEPDVEWKLAGEEQDVVEISLPGFRKDQVRVQVDNHGVLRATGERPTRGGRWARFKKDLRLPDNCDADGVRARFEGEKLIITLPIFPTGATPSPPLPPSPSPSHSPTPSPPLVEPLSPSPSHSPTPSPPLVEPLSPSPSHSPIPSPSHSPTPSPSHSPTPEPKPSTPPLWQTPDSVSVSLPPAPGPLPLAEQSPKKRQLPDTSTVTTMVRQEDSRPPAPPPPTEKKRSKKTKRAEELGGGVRGKVDDETARGAKRPEKDSQAGALPAVGDAPTTATKTAEPGRQLLVNAAAAVAVLVGIIVAVWRTLQS